MPQATELEVFLPQDGSNMKDNIHSGKYKVNVKSKDAEAAYVNHDGKDSFDPFRKGSWIILPLTVTLSLTC